MSTVTRTHDLRKAANRIYRLSAMLTELANLAEDLNLNLAVVVVGSKEGEGKVVDAEFAEVGEPVDLSAPAAAPAPVKRIPLKRKGASPQPRGATSRLQEIIDYVRVHGPVRPGQVSAATGVGLSTVANHFHKNPQRFKSNGDGTWSMRRKKS